MSLARSIVGLLACPLAALAQQPVPQQLTLATAIALARDNSPAYRQALINRAPASWGVRNAYALLLPSVTASGGLGYSGTGQQLFLTSAFNQQVSTWSSNYSIGLDWELSGATLSQPGLRRAQLAAVEADIRGAEVALVSNVTQQYLTVLQAVENARVAQAQLEHNDEFLKLAQARFDVGRATLIDVRQAQVARGQAQVALLRARTATDVEMLRLFEVLGIAAPDPVSTQQLADTFPVQEPAWRLGDLLAMAEAQNPALAALRARENAATWGVRAASSSYGPSLSFTAGWSGYTQKATDLNPVIAQVKAQADTNIALCQYENTAWLNPGQPALPCGLLAFSPESIQTLRDRNNAYPFHFISQPFQARFTITLPLFTNFSRPLQVSQAGAQRDDLTESVRARGLQVRTEVTQAYLVLETAYRAIGIQDTNRTAALEQLQLATERYRVGSGTFFELLDAQLAQLNAEYDYVNAIYAYHKSVAALEAAVGRPLR